MAATHGRSTAIPSQGLVSSPSPFEPSRGGGKDATFSVNELRIVGMGDVLYS